MLNAAVSEKNVAVKKASLIIWTVQLALNLAWPFIFFSLDLKTVAFIVSSFITVCLIAVIALDFFYCRPGAWLNIPYALWLGFATYLTMFIALYN